MTSKKRRGIILTFDTHILGFLIAFLLAIVIVPVVRKFCIKKGYVDQPNARKMHKKPTPRLGGIAIWLCTVLAFGTVVLINYDYPNGNCLSGIIIGGSLMFLLGLVDDLYDLPPGLKLFIQIGAALIAFLLGVKIDIISNPLGDPISLGLLSLPITILWLVGITNAVNFIDGLDGLAGGVVTIMAVTLGVVAVVTEQPASAIIAALLAGAVMGFLLFNFYPARIFMGDSGALFSGFVLAGLSVTGVIKTVTASVLLPVLIFSVPIMDMSFSVSRRLIKGSNPLKADKEHIHHKLISSGLSQNRTVAILYLVCISCGTIATFLVGAQNLYLFLIAFILLFMAIFYFVAKLRHTKELKEYGRINNTGKL